MTPLLFIGLMFFGAFIGAMSGFFGIGGGAFLVPLLVRFGGLPWDQAIALSLAQMIPTGCIGAWRRWIQGEVNARLALLSLGGSIPGAWLGRMIVRMLGERGTIDLGSLKLNILDTGLSFAFIGFLCWMGSRMWRDQGAAPRVTAGSRAECDAALSDGAGREGEKPIPVFEAWLLGLGVGTTSSLLGIGGGFLFVPVAVQRFGLPVVTAVGASLLQLPVTAAVGAYLYLSVEGTPYLWLIPIIMGSSFGVVQGVAISKRFDNTQLKRILAGMLLGVSLMLLVSWLRNTLAGH